MAEADTSSYWNAMAAYRAARPQIPGASYSVQSCKAFLTGDIGYAEQCPEAWLQYGSGASPELVFPRSFFNWCQRYLRAALQKKPIANHSSAEFKVIWALDVWAVTNYALFALNLPWSDLLSPSGPNPGTGTEPIFKFSWHTTAPTSLDAETAAWHKAINEAQSSSVPAIAEAYRNSRLNPAPFSELATQWAAAPGARSALYKKQNPIWGLLLETVQPWSNTWSDNWISSKGNKDAADFRRYAGDPALLNGCIQWRLWSVQDWGYAGADPSYWPIGMGRADSCATLSSYINYAKGEATAPKITFQGTQAYPNLAFGLADVALLAANVLSVSYDALLSKYLGWWIATEGPRFDASGSLLTVNQWLSQNSLPANPTPVGAQPARQPVTFGDYADLYRGLAKAVLERAKATAINPGAQCPPNNSACLEAAKAFKAAQNSPLGPVLGDMIKWMSKLFEVFGVSGAVGTGYVPIFVLRHPFARTLAAPGWRLLADGSSGDVLARLGQAVANYGGALPGLFAAPVAAQPTKACKIYWTHEPNGASNACTVCPGDPLPACAQYVPNLEQPTSNKPTPACYSAWLEMTKTPEARAISRCLDEEGYSTFLQLCSQVSAGQMTDAQSKQSWAAYLQSRRCAVPGATAGLWAAFRRSFFSASNPLQR